MARRQPLTAFLIAAVLAVFTLCYLLSGSDFAREAASVPVAKGKGQGQGQKQEQVQRQSAGAHHGDGVDALEGKPIDAAEMEGISAGVLGGGSIAPKLENATAK